MVSLLNSNKIIYEYFIKSFFETRDLEQPAESFVLFFISALRIDLEKTYLLFPDSNGAEFKSIFGFVINDFPLSSKFLL